AGVLARRELVDGGFGPDPGLLRRRVHALAQRSGVVQVRRLLEAERRDAEGADVVFPRESDHPAVAPGHVDDLAVHAELLEVARRPLGLLRDLLPGLEHPDRDGKRLGPDVEVQLPVGGLGVNHGLSSVTGTARPAPTGGGLPQARVAPLACSTALRRVWLRSPVQRRRRRPCSPARPFNGTPATVWLRSRTSR